LGANVSGQPISPTFKGQGVQEEILHGLTDQSTLHNILEQRRSQICGPSENEI